MEINNIGQLRDDLVNVYKQVRADPSKAGQGKVAARVAGKVISGVQAQMKYAQLRGEQPKIAFLEE